MKTIHRFFLIVALSLVPLLSFAGTIEREAEQREQADTWFDNAQYEMAYMEYLSLAQEGDKFAQFRLSLIEYFGLVENSSKLKAAAWAGVAQEEEIKPLRQLYKLIWAELDVAQQNEAKMLISEWDSNFGVAITPKKKRRASRRKRCTGSRVGANCDRVFSNGVSGFATSEEYTSNNNVAHVWKEDDLKDFLDRYQSRFYADFERFDQQNG
jgi:hypothetical protein